ncbi:hypothetical protein NLI96_g1109 [Meripilus lineatus]|uniref:Uncharacterized protein n=1 Tax=Meripilus lineatus TaxID=2056292 RepID=A0AAD5VAW9_9APHY|nr:hypothetical protein NLI96_g1109 [Physisporinus lineatus]
MSFEPEFEGFTCPHLNGTLSSEPEGQRLLKSYRTVVSWSVQRAHDVHQSKRRKDSSATQHVGAADRFFQDLQCACHVLSRDVGQKATSGNISSRQVTISVGVDAKSGAIFCRECDDFVYNGNILDAFTQASLNVEERSTGFEVQKKAREPFKPWAPTAKDTDALVGAETLRCQGGDSPSTWLTDHAVNFTH